MNKRKKLILDDGSYIGLGCRTALGGMAFVLFAIGLGHRSSDRRGINRLSEGQVWLAWKLRTGEWQRIVEAEHQQMRPEEGLGVYAGALHAGIAGLVLGGFMMAVARFVIEDEELVPIFVIAAIALLLLLVGVRLLQPVKARYEARKYRMRALRVAEPRVWYGSDGLYHETLGYSSLRNLVDVTDQTEAGRGSDSLPRSPAPSEVCPALRRL